MQKSSQTVVYVKEKRENKAKSFLLFYQTISFDMLKMAKKPN